MKPNPSALPWVGSSHKSIGWRPIDSSGKSWSPPVSVGQLLGYESEIAQYIWSEIEKHFKNKPMDEWDTMETNGDVKIEDFKLSLDIKLEMWMSEPKRVKTFCEEFKEKLNKDR